MTKAEREAMRAGAQEAAGKPVTPAAVAAETRAIDKKRAADLDDPQTQAKIEMPKVVDYVLRLSDGDRLVSMSTEFTHEQVYDFNLLEDLQSFSQLVIGELRAAEFTPGDAAAYTAAMTTARVRAAVRRLLAKTSRYKEPWTSYDARDRKIEHIRPTDDELRSGIVLEDGEPNLFAMRHFADILFGMYSEEVERRKNARAAAVSN